MSVIGVSTEINSKRKLFFQMAFGQSSGFVCLASMPHGKKGITEEFFQYPEELDQMLERINRLYMGNNIYFCPQLLNTKRRKKENIKECSNAWADLDTCPPEQMLIPATISVESSPGRYQALWVFEHPVEPEEAEDVSKRIAYHHAEQGADRSGWDLTQLLRVPFTYNYKYGQGGIEVPMVKPIDANRLRYRLEDFEEYPQAAGFTFNELPFPESEALANLNADDILQRYRLKLNPIVWSLHQTVPDDDWSKPLWNLQMALFEAGMTREEVFIVTSESKCNKYARDQRDPQLLWKEVCRAFTKSEENSGIIFPSSYSESALLTDEERTANDANPGFVERYIEWARGLGDAAWQYHQAGAFTALSSLLAGTVRLPTSYGTILPNLWFMILADTTLTRKSTAMDIAMDLIMEIDADSVLATDGSIEGLLTSLSTRPGRPSIFLRDEFSGLLEAMTKKDYMAGMPELLTKLYDGKMMKRILRKETIEVKEPVLIMLTGGIKSKITSLLTFEQVSSGFMPRFIFITAESDVTRLKPLGPPTEIDIGNREAIKQELLDIHAHYNPPMQTVVTPTAVTFPTRKIWNAELTPDAWERYNKLEAQMLQAGVEHDHPEIMTPTYDRLSKSTLKASVLVAASRQRGPEGVTVELADLLKAIGYCERWREYVKEVMNNVGKGTVEKQLDTIFSAIQKREGVSRSVIMQNYHLSARDANQVFDTLEQRGLITRSKVGRTEMLFAVKR